MGIFLTDLKFSNSQITEFFFGINRSPSYLCTPLKTRTWPVRLRARTPPFHGGDTGSNPVRATEETPLFGGVFLFRIFRISG